MNELQIFTNDEFGAIRVIEKCGEPWFIGKDVADLLGYAETAKAIRMHVEAEDKGVSVLDTPGGKQNLVIINESGLYSLILSSKLPSAKHFKKWVTAEVLPAIRKHGVYAIDEVIKNPDMLIAALTSLKEEREKSNALTQLVAVQNQQISELQPKASYYDIVLQCRDVVPITVIAKDYGWSAKRMNQYLHDKGVQFKQGRTWLLYQRYAEMGYTQTKTSTHPGSDGEQHIDVHTYWTQRGRLFIYDLLRQDDILPVMERSDGNGR